MEIFKKLNNSRKFIKRSDLKKAGRNDYSGYDYYTPEQVDKLVHDACKENGIIDLFNLKKNEFGFYGELTLLNIEDSKDQIVFTQSTDIPTITATNIAQQIGGAVTYTKRYMLMTAFDIVDNNLDFDTLKSNSKTPQNKNKVNVDVWLTENAFNKTKSLSASDIQKCLDKYNGKPYSDNKVYSMKKDYRTELQKLVK